MPKVQHYALGKLPAREDAILYQFAWFFSQPDLPVPPAVYGVWQHFWNIADYQNKTIGNCVFAGYANETSSWAHDVKKWIKFTDENVISDYSAVSGYDGSKKSDTGADMGIAAEYRRKTGVVDHNGIRHKIDAYVKLSKKNFDDLKIAMYLFGAVGIGLEYPQHAYTQIAAGKPWDVIKGKDKVLGGHYVSGVGIDKDGYIVVTTWGKYQRMTREFFEKYNDESSCCFSIERCMNRTSPEGFDANKLIGYLKDLKSPFGYSGFNT